MEKTGGTLFVKLTSKTALLYAPFVDQYLFVPKGVTLMEAKGGNAQIIKTAGNIVFLVQNLWFVEFASLLLWIDAN